jgi:hypothetical protein
MLGRTAPESDELVERRRPGGWYAGLRPAGSRENFRKTRGARLTFCAAACRPEAGVPAAEDGGAPTRVPSDRVVLDPIPQPNDCHDSNFTSDHRRLSRSLASLGTDVSNLQTPASYI